MNQSIRPAKKLTGTISEMPPDKSIAHRAAMFAALAEGESVISGYSSAADPQSTLDCLEGLGVEILRNVSEIRIQGKGRYGLKAVKPVLDCGNSGTTMRLLSGIIAGAGLETELRGDASLSARPMKRILDPLRLMGARIQAKDSNFAPIQFQSAAGGGLQPIRYKLPVASAQVKSCVLLAGLFQNEATVVVEKLRSRDHTERMLGLKSETNERGETLIYSSSADQIQPFHGKIPGDISGAAFWMVAASILPGSEILLRHVGINPTRSSVIQILKRMGADIVIQPLDADDSIGNEPVADIIIRSAPLKATEIYPEEVPNAIDEIPVLSVAMAFAEGTSEIRNASELRAKETDRINAVRTMLETAGAEVTELEDGLIITGNSGLIPPGAAYASFHDHRIAMASAVLALKSNQASTVKGAECAAISYPDFWDHLEMLAG